MILAALTMMLATTDDPRLIGIADAKAAVRMLDAAKRCNIRASTDPLPFDPNARIPVRLLAILADKPMKESDPRMKCYIRRAYAGVPVLRDPDYPR